jgi:hypothetical protein
MYILLSYIYILLFIYSINIDKTDLFPTTFVYIDIYIMLLFILIILILIYICNMHHK